jgi:hypothetical protein
LVTAAVLVFAAGCSSSEASSDGSRSSQVSPERALEQLFAAEQRGDYDASYAYVVHTDPGGVAATKAQWRQARQDLPAVLDFTVNSVDGKVVATVTHEPTLDPFVGLVPARELQTWTPERSGDGWLLRPDPTVDPVLPTDAGAVDAAREWYRAVQRCDQAAAERLQAVTTLFDSTSNDARVCGAGGDARVDASVARLPAGPISGDIVAQYSSSALSWGRVVQVVAPVPLSIVLAPLGDAWRVVGIGDPL